MYGSGWVEDGVGRLCIYMEEESRPAGAGLLGPRGRQETTQGRKAVRCPGAAAFVEGPAAGRRLAELAGVGEWLAQGAWGAQQQAARARQRGDGEAAGGKPPSRMEPAEPELLLLDTPSSTPLPPLSLYCSCSFHISLTHTHLFNLRWLSRRTFRRSRSIWRSRSCRWRTPPAQRRCPQRLRRSTLLPSKILPSRYQILQHQGRQSIYDFYWNGS